MLCMLRLGLFSLARGDMDGEEGVRSMRWARGLLYWGSCRGEFFSISGTVILGRRLGGESARYLGLRNIMMETTILKNVFLVSVPLWFRTQSLLLLGVMWVEVFHHRR